MQVSQISFFVCKVDRSVFVHICDTLSHHGLDFEEIKIPRAEIFFSKSLFCSLSSLKALP